MTELLRGRFDCKVDGKGRISLPANLRSQIEVAFLQSRAPRSEAATRSRSIQPEAPSRASASVTLIVTNSLFKNRRCLDVYTEAEWMRLEARVASLPSLKIEVQAYQRFYLSAGQTVELDGQHRLLIPQSLRKFAGIDESVVVIGMGSKFEVWSEPVWLELQEELSAQFGDMQAAVALLEEAL